MTFQGPDPQQPASQPWPQQPPYPGQQPPQQPQPYPEQQVQPYPGRQPDQPSAGWAQPAQQQAPYPSQPQQYDAQQYGAQPQPGAPWPQQPQPGQPDFGQAWQGQQPQAKNRSALIAAGAVVVVAAIGVGVFVMTSSNNSNKTNTAGGATTGATATAGASTGTPTGASTGAGSVPVTNAAGATLVVPASAGGLSQMTGSVADNVVSAMKKADSGVSIYDHALFGAYEQSGTSKYFADLTLVPMAQSGPIYSAFTSQGAAATIKEIEQSATLTNIADEPAATSGGAMACGTLTTSQIVLTTCIWVDGNEYGISALPNTLSNDQAATYAAALEKASEQS